MPTHKKNRIDKNEEKRKWHHTNITIYMFYLLFSGKRVDNRSFPLQNTNRIKIYRLFIAKHCRWNSIWIKFQCGLTGIAAVQSTFRTLCSFPYRILISLQITSSNWHQHEGLTHEHRHNQHLRSLRKTHRGFSGMHRYCAPIGSAFMLFWFRRLSLFSFPFNDSMLHLPSSDFVC